MRAAKRLQLGHLRVVEPRAREPAPEHEQGARRGLAHRQQPARARVLERGAVGGLERRVLERRHPAGGEVQRQAFEQHRRRGPRARRHQALATGRHQHGAAVEAQRLMEHLARRAQDRVRGVVPERVVPGPFGQRPLTALAAGEHPQAPAHRPRHHQRRDDERERGAAHAAREVGAPHRRDAFADDVRRARERGHQQRADARAQRDAEVEDAVHRDRPRERRGHQQREQRRPALARQRHARRQVAQRHQTRERDHAERGAGEHHAQPPARVGGAGAQIGAGEQREGPQQAHHEPRSGRDVERVEGVLGGARARQPHRLEGDGGDEQHGRHPVAHAHRGAERSARAARLGEQREEVDEQRGQEQLRGRHRQLVDARDVDGPESRRGHQHHRERQAEQQEDARQRIASFAPHPAAEQHESRGDQQLADPLAPVARRQGLGREPDAPLRAAAFEHEGQRAPGRGRHERRVGGLAGAGGSEAVARPHSRARARAAGIDVLDHVAARHQSGVPAPGQAQGRRHEQGDRRNEKP